MATTVPFLMVATFLLFATKLQVGSSVGDPILLVPGITGSQLYVQDSRLRTWCNTHRWFGFFGRTDSRQLWISWTRILFKFGCFTREMELKFDEQSKQFSSKDDKVVVTAPGFGYTDTVEKLGHDLVDIPYLQDFVEYFVARGYERGKSIRAAPYDWRLAPDELQRMGYHNNLKSLIETMYTENGNTKVTIAAHSMGAPTILHFLTQSGVVDQEWKNKYIGNFITLSGAWSGGNIALQIEISVRSVAAHMKDILNPFSHFIMMQLIESNIKRLSSMIHSFQSLSFLLPRPSVWGDRVLVTTPSRTYTANDYEDLFSDIGLADGFAMYQGIEGINANYPAPNVPTHCFYGVGVDTPESFTYSKSFPKGAEDDSEVTMGNGDGTVNILSSEVCLRWANSTSPFTTKTFNNVSHLQIVKDIDALKEIEKIVGAFHTSNQII